MQIKRYITAIINPAIGPRVFRRYRPGQYRVLVLFTASFSSGPGLKVGSGTCSSSTLGSSGLVYRILILSSPFLKYLEPLSFQRLTLGSYKHQLYLQISPSQPRLPSTSQSFSKNYVPAAAGPGVFFSVNLSFFWFNQLQIIRPDYRCFINPGLESSCNLSQDCLLAVTE